MAWILEHRQLIATLSSVGMLIIWITYLQIFLASYRRQRKATILIRLGQGHGLDAHCLVTNMSAEPIYIHTLVAQLDGPSGVLTCPITELDGEDPADETAQIIGTRQGPLKSGHIRDMGTIGTIIDHVRRAASTEGSAVQLGADLRALEIRVVAVYGSEDLPVGARRGFDIVQHDGAPALRPHGYGAVQIRSRRERKAMARALAEEVQPIV